MHTRVETHEWASSVRTERKQIHRNGSKSPRALTLRWQVTHMIIAITASASSLVILLARTFTQGVIKGTHRLPAIYSQPSTSATCDMRPSAPVPPLARGRPADIAGVSLEGA